MKIRDDKCVGRFPGRQRGASASRRTFLRASGALAATGLVGGCIGGSGGGDYPSEDIRWVVPYSSGGLFDGYSRIVAENMPEFLPNDVNMPVENVTGAGGRTGANEIYRAEPNGYTIGLVNDPGFVIYQLIDETEYDMMEYSYLGRIAYDPHVLVVNPDSELNSVEDLQAADQVVFSAPGLSTNAANFAILAGEVLDFNVDFVTGFDGMAEARTAVMRNDVDAALSIVSSAVSSIEDGDLRALIVFDTEPGDYAPDAPTIGDLGHEEFGELFRLNWMAAGPPELPDDVLGTLEEAFLETLDSDPVQQWSAENDASINPAGSEDAAAMVEETSTVFEEYLDTIQEYH